MAEALLIGIRPELGVTKGIVTIERAKQLLQVAKELGWKAAKPHLDAWEVEEEVLDAVASHYREAVSTSESFVEQLPNETNIGDYRTLTQIL